MPSMHLITGGRRMKDPAEPIAFNARRCKWVKKRLERTETVAGGDADLASQMHPGGKK